MQSEAPNQYPLQGRGGRLYRGRSTQNGDYRVIPGYFPWNRL